MKRRISGSGAMILFAVLLMTGICLWANRAPMVVHTVSGTVNGSAGHYVITDDGAKLDINRADREELMQLTGIGETLAERIIEDRERNGAYETISDLTRVSGIGEGILAKNEMQICVGE